MDKKTFTMDVNVMRLNPEWMARFADFVYLEGLDLWQHRFLLQS
jgi:hypothetical protein